MKAVVIREPSPPDVLAIEEPAGSGSSTQTFSTRQTLYVADSERGEVLVLEPNGRAHTFISGLRSPLGIAVDSDESVLVSDSMANQIYRFGADPLAPQPSSRRAHWPSADAPIAQKPGGGFCPGGFRHTPGVARDLQEASWRNPEEKHWTGRTRPARIDSYHSQGRRTAGPSPRTPVTWSGQNPHSLEGES